MNKKTLSKEEFYNIANAEVIAFNIYDYLIRRKLKDEYVDKIVSSYSLLLIKEDNVLDIYSRVNEVLEKDYDCDMLSLPFYNMELYNDVENHINKSIKI